MSLVTLSPLTLAPRQSFLVVNSHLTFPHSQLYKDMRLEQIKAVLVAVRDYITRESLHSVPIVRPTAAGWLLVVGCWLLGNSRVVVLQLMCGDFNDSYDAVHSLVTDEGFASVFAHVNGREARITHCNHNNREVGVDFIFASHLQGDTRSTRRRVQELVVAAGDGEAQALETDESDSDSDSDDEQQQQQQPARLQLVPRDCHLSPRRLTDATRLKRPSFGHDWRTVEHPEGDEHHDDDALVDYWRMLSDHRPLIASFDVLSPASPSDRIV